jgi:hypothetical protein
VAANYKLIKNKNMASKITWKKQKPIGNVKASWEGSVKGFDDIESISLVEIRVFKKGEFVLPTNWFPRYKKFGMCQTTKTLLAAKKKCQKWWDEFIMRNR